MTTPTTAATGTVGPQARPGTIRDAILEDLFRCTLDLCRGGQSLTRQDPIVDRVIGDLDRVIRLLRDSARLDDEAPARRREV
jgi:hypothetical protein